MEHLSNIFCLNPFWKLCPNSCPSVVSPYMARRLCKHRYLYYELISDQTMNFNQILVEHNRREQAIRDSIIMTSMSCHIPSQPRSLLSTEEFAQRLKRRSLQVLGKMMVTNNVDLAVDFLNVDHSVMTMEDTSEKLTWDDTICRHGVDLDPGEISTVFEPSEPDIIDMMRNNEVEGDKISFDISDLPNIDLINTLWKIEKDTAENSL